MTDAGDKDRSLKILALGTCQVEALSSLSDRANIDVSIYIYNCSPGASVSSLKAESFDAIVVSLTLRNILSQVVGREFLFSHLTQANFDPLSTSCFNLLLRHISHICELAHGIPVFFNTFLEPSFDYDGILIRNRYSPKRFIYDLNNRLGDEIASRSNCYILDINEIISWVGRAYTQDDTFTALSHNSLLHDWNSEFDNGRIEKPASISQLKNARAYDDLLGVSYWGRVRDAIKILHHINQVKLIVVDLDDTLWRGIAGEVAALEKWKIAEGWPLGVVEALLFFKRRGGLLAICSKNDYNTAVDHMRYVYDDNLTPADFVSIKINWQSKSESIGQILKEVNVLEESVLYIDDNPREIEEISRRYPKIRMLSGNPFLWRETILRTAETQVQIITAESANRTQSLRALISSRDETNAFEATDREARERWLHSLALTQRIRSLCSVASSDFDRCFELLNKTNQFNTSGVRWSYKDVSCLFDEGGYFLYTSLNDRLVDNGIVGLAIVVEAEIRQVVLSCRVFGLGVDTMLGSILVDKILSGYGKAVGRIIDTGKNFACHGFFRDLGFIEVDGGFEISHPIERPSWINLAEHPHF